MLLTMVAVLLKVRLIATEWHWRAKTASSKPESYAEKENAATTEDGLQLVDDVVDPPSGNHGK